MIREATLPGQSTVPAPGLLGYPWQLARRIWQARRERDYRSRQKRIADLFLQHYGPRVLQGPFAGMIYLGRSHNSEFVPKLLGSYESELADILDEVIRRNYRVVVDIGCAEGYYAVGLARRCLEATVYAFDIDPAAQVSCGEMARKNGVEDRVVLGAACSASELNQLPLAGAFLICDCEGCEHDLLSPADVPLLAECDMLVELHDYVNPEITTSLLRRFAPTHHVRLIPSVNRNPDLYPALWYLRNVRDRKIAVGEERLPMNWAYLTVRRRA